MIWVWNTDLELVGGILAVAMLYRMALRLGRARFAPDSPFPLRSVLLMDTALVVFYLAVGSPLDEAGDHFLFFAHMIQHSVLIFLLPPLMLAAMPSWMFLPLAENPTARAIFSFLVSPLVALSSFTVIFTLWHLPVLYEFALRDRQVHNVEHSMFVLTALQAWWPVVSQSEEFPRLRPGPRMLYLFLATLSQIPLFGFLTMSRVPYYPTYIEAPRILPITPLQDQIIGGILMKFLGEIVFGGYLLLAFAEWYHERQEEGSDVAPVARAVATLDAHDSEGDASSGAD